MLQPYRWVAKTPGNVATALNPKPGPAHVSCMILGQHRADDDLLAGDHELAVVPGEVALLVAHHPHAGVGDVRSRLGVAAVRAWLVAGAAPAAPLAGRGGSVPCNRC